MKVKSVSNDSDMMEDDVASQLALLSDTLNTGVRQSKLNQVLEMPFAKMLLYITLVISY